MKVRYKQGKNGLVPVANVYSGAEHKIEESSVDKDAVYVIETLRDSGFEAFLVGGAVRDLMLGKIPKDFDVVTSASPRKVHKIFKNSRIIGHRFKLVHVVFGEKIIEVSTFRSTREHDEDSDNCYGTIEEDAKRRDFSINSFYFDPSELILYDFNNAMRDFKRKKITSLIPLNRTFIEDPVRMIRAVKCSVTTGFKLRLNVRFAIKKYASELLSVSVSRLTDELGKIFLCGKSCDVIRALEHYGLLPYLLPSISIYPYKNVMYSALADVDEEIRVAKEKSSLDIGYRAKVYYALCKQFLVIPDESLSFLERRSDIFRQIRVLISPNTPPNSDIDAVCRIFMLENKIEPDRPKAKKRRYRRKNRHGNEKAVQGSANQTENLIQESQESAAGEIGAEVKKSE